MDAKLANKAFLIVDGSKVFHLDWDVTRIGRHQDNHLVLLESFISRFHVEIHQDGSNFILRDMESTGGTSVNGEPITETQLKPGDVISVAGLPLIFGTFGGSPPIDDYVVTKGRRVGSITPTQAVETEQQDDYIHLFDEDNGEE